MCTEACSIRERDVFDSHKACALASNEQDPAKLLVLTREIARLLAEKEQRVKEIHRQVKEQEEGKGDVSSIPPATSESSG